MSTYTEQAAAIAAFGARVERLGELQKLYEIGQLTEKDLGQAVAKAKEATEADRELLKEASRAALGPFDPDKYDALQLALQERLEELQRLRDLYHRGEVEAPSLYEAFSEFVALWWFMEPWREEIAEYVEALPGMVEAERQAALKGRGFRVPTERRTKKKTTATQLRTRAFELLGEARKMGPDGKR